MPETPDLRTSAERLRELHHGALLVSIDTG